MTAGRLSHIDASGHAIMVDVTDKPVTDRIATARGRVAMAPATLALIVEGGGEEGRRACRRPARRHHGGQAHQRPDPAVPPAADLLGRRWNWRRRRTAAGIDIAATVRTTGRTGVEMEALTAVSVAALTIYDMCKAVDRAMRIEAVRVVQKSGGASGDFVQD